MVCVLDSKKWNIIGFQIISNGEYKSVQHRVVANSKKEARISIVEFFSADDGSGEYGPLTELLSPEKPPLYRKFTMNEFNENFYKKGLDSKSLIQKLSLWVVYVWYWRRARLNPEPKLVVRAMSTYIIMLFNKIRRMHNISYDYTLN